MRSTATSGPEEVPYDKGERREKRTKYESLAICYEGLRAFYAERLYAAEQRGNHEEYLRWHLLWSWCGTQVQFLREGIRRTLGKMFARYVLGYGDRPLRPLTAWISINGAFAFLYLLTGVRLDRRVIQRMVKFDGSQLGDTLKDLGRCLYFSIITATTVGFGDVQPANGISMALAAAQAVMSLILMTMFTVVLVRRFFR